jgi:hypothetical protein
MSSSNGTDWIPQTAPFPHAERDSSLRRHFELDDLYETERPGSWWEEGNIWMGARVCDNQAVSVCHRRVSMQY